MSTHSISSGRAPKLFDVHTHVQFHVFKNDADIVIQRALDAGIWMINVGTQKDTSESAIRFAEKYPEGVYATVGLHPIHTSKSHHDAQELDGNEEFTSRGEVFDFETYKKLAEHPKVVGIGECGLDYYRFKNDDLGFKNKQIETFISQIELAKEVNKPLMIHCRNAFADLIKILQATNYPSTIRQTHGGEQGRTTSSGSRAKSRDQLQTNPGVIHFFSGSKDDAKELLDLGFSFSFGGVITFARDYDEVVQYIPLERIVLETDAPYITPVPHRGKRNEPLYVIEVAKKLAKLKNVSIEAVQDITTISAQKVFKLARD